MFDLTSQDSPNAKTVSTVCIYICPEQTANYPCIDGIENVAIHITQQADEILTEDTECAKTSSNLSEFADRWQCLSCNRQGKFLTARKDDNVETVIIVREIGAW